MKPVDLLVEIFLALLGAYTAEAINCFQCDFSDTGCGNITATDIKNPYFKKCEIANGTIPFCRKTIQQLIFDKTETVRIARACGWITEKPNVDKCFKYDTQFKFDTTCQCYEEGCNSAPTISQTKLILIIPSVLMTYSLFKL